MSTFARLVTVPHTPLDNFLLCINTDDSQLSETEVVLLSDTAELAVRDYVAPKGWIIVKGQRIASDNLAIGEVRLGGSLVIGCKDGDFIFPGLILQLVPRPTVLEMFSGYKIIPSIIRSEANLRSL